MLIGPRIEVKAVEGDPLGADRDLREAGAHLGAEPVAVHAEVGYAPNAVNGMKAAIMPPPGTFVLENGSLFYYTHEFVDSSGDRIPTSTTNAFANRTILGYVSNSEILGANFNPAVIPIFANQLVRPEPGSKKDLQLADMVV